jgi:multidrug efflux system membrane fusion protein
MRLKQQALLSSMRGDGNPNEAYLCAFKARIPVESEGKPRSGYVGLDHQLPADSVVNPHSRRKRVVIWIIVLLLVALVVFLLIRHHESVKKAEAAKKKPVPAVSVTPANSRTGDIGVYLDAIGTVTPVYTASITSQVTGVIVAVHYKEGQLVQKGTPLIDIDDRPFRAQLTQAQGTLEHDTNILGQAQMDLERYRKAWALNAIQKQTLDDQEKIVLQDQGTVKTDQGVVQYDEVQISYCHIHAPFTGRTGLRLVDPGNTVQASGTNPLVVITQVQPITVIFTIAEDSLGQVQQQLKNKAKLVVDAYDRAAMKKIAGGTLISVDNQIDTTTGTVKFRAQYDNKDNSLFPNEFVNVRLLVTTHHGVTLVPTSVIQHNGQAAFVYVIQNNVAQMKPVKTGTTDGSTTEVEGIGGGEVLANSSFDKLQNGTKVKLSKQQQSTQASGSDAP